MLVTPKPVAKFAWKYLLVKTSIIQEPVNWLLCRSIDRLFDQTLWSNFFLKGISEQTLIKDTLINCKIILTLYILNSTNQGYLLMVYYHGTQKYFFKIYVIDTNKIEKYQKSNLLTRTFTMRYFFKMEHGRQCKRMYAILNIFNSLYL